MGIVSILGMLVLSYNIVFIWINIAKGFQLLQLNKRRGKGTYGNIPPSHFFTSTVINIIIITGILIIAWSIEV